MDSTLHSQNFDILNAQIAKEVRFEDIPKPTELAPFHPDEVGNKNENEKEEVAEEGHPVRVKILEQEKKTDAPKKFALPKELSPYILGLIKEGRKLRGLLFDLDFAASNQAIKDLILAEQFKGTIREEEKKEMFRFLQEDVRPKVVLSDPLKQEKAEKLRSDYGIVID